MSLIKVEGITVLNYSYRAHASTFFHSFLQAAVKPVRSSKLETSLVQFIYMIWSQSLLWNCSMNLKSLYITHPVGKLFIDRSSLQGQAGWA